MSKRKSDERFELLNESVGNYIREAGNKTFNYKQVSYAIGADTSEEQRAVALILARKAYEGDLVEVEPGKYQAVRSGSEAEGVFQRRSNGKNSVILDGEEEAIFVAERNSMHALNGDRVRVMVSARIRGKEPEAVVTEIIEAKEQTFIGTLRVEKGYAYLETDSKFLPTDIYIPKNKLKGGRSGEKAIVKITEWPEDAKNPRGAVVDVLGKSGDNNAEMHAILAEFSLPYRYPEAVVAAAEKINHGITPEEVAVRRDMRGILTFTIDPKDAKDFDDALSFRRLPNGNVEVGVHIADVTHYVRPESIINKEGQSRATSVYLVDRVVPMLPERLSNEICSLRPDEDKLTFSCVFEMNSQAEVVKYEICRTVIRSTRRYTYEEAQNVIETGKGDNCDAILELDRMAKIMRKRRFKDGSVEFDREEVRFEIDETGHPVKVYFKESKDSNKLIEEFMLLANRTVAEHIGRKREGKKPKTFVYRIHESPDPEKLAQLSKLASRFGYKVVTRGTGEDVNKSINRLLEDVKGKPEENLLTLMTLRTMSKAVYTTNNTGHYGLGFEYYTHFTSPIRRYPDMMVHRLLARYMEGGRSVPREKVEDECKHSSDMEQRAANAERASIKYKQVEYMADRIGQVFRGMISGVTEWGLYVELEENKCEGLIPIRDLEDDYYEFDQENMCLIGQRYHTVYRLGDMVDVQVARADLERKQLDFFLIDDSHPARKPSTFKKKQSSKPSGKKKS